MQSYVTGFPRIGEKRELKFALEQYWRGEIGFDQLQETATTLQRRHLRYQKEAGIEAISVGDFSYYDQTLDMIVALGLEPAEYLDIEDPIARYFAMARGDKTHKALEMTKWFNTNYHYLVPLLDRIDEGRGVDASHFAAAYRLAKSEAITPKINLVGPLTFLANAKCSDGSDETFAYYERVIARYEALLLELSKLDDRVTIQFDEPIFATDRTEGLGLLIKDAYTRLCRVAPNLTLYVVNYFDHACEATKVLCTTPVAGIGLDFVYGNENLQTLEAIAQSGKQLIAGVIDGRNIWISDLDAKLSLLKRIAEVVPKAKISVSSSCSLQHLPYSLRFEEAMDTQIKQWLAFALERLEEISLLSKRFFDGTLDSKAQAQWEAKRCANEARKNSTLIRNDAVQTRMQEIEGYKKARTPFEKRIEKQHERFGYLPLCTTTIGSFPQSDAVRQTRRAYKNGEIDEATYIERIKGFIRDCVALQEEVGLEVLVHGEFERNDMVEYFGEQLAGVTFSQNGWVQSYGSRCVKPPIIYGDVSRPEPMTLFWSRYAQSLSNKPMKGMLTGAVTILNWSFVRDDQPRAETCYQIALAIRDEIDDLQKAGIGMIQVDEAAFKEGYPLRREKREAYERFALESFRISTGVADDETQIHTHMCYSEFDDIIETIEAMDADVISIETARSGNTLLKVFKEKGYRQEIGPGVYDIHSPRIPSIEEIEVQIEALLEVLPARQLWINPDCGLKTRREEEVKPALRHMVEAVRRVRQKHGIG